MSMNGISLEIEQGGEWSNEVGDTRTVSLSIMSIMSKSSVLMCTVILMCTEGAAKSITPNYYFSSL